MIRFIRFTCINISIDSTRHNSQLPPRFIVRFAFLLLYASFIILVLWITNNGSILVSAIAIPSEIFPNLNQTMPPVPLLPHKPDASLLESFRYINSMPGKNVRGIMIDCFQLWMNVESSDVLNSIKVCEIFFSGYCRK